MIDFKSLGNNNRNRYALKNIYLKEQAKKKKKKDRKKIE